MKFLDEYESPNCKLAKFLYKRDILCGKDCPLGSDTCPVLILQDAGDFSSDAMMKLMIDYLERQEKE